MGFIFAIGDAIKGKKIRDVKVEELDKQSVLVGIINLLEELDKWVTEFPPAEQQQRFGNKAFRDWHERLEQVSTVKFRANAYSRANTHPPFFVVGNWGIRSLQYF